MNRINQNKSAIFLIGGRACGKTTIGKMLAATLDMKFLDMDKIIEEEEGRKICELVEADGWDSFRKKEKHLLERLVNNKNCVIATGGGAILHQEVWPDIMKTGYVIWLNAGTETVRARLKADKQTQAQRPSLTGDDVLSETEKIMVEREPLYRSGSHVQIDTELPLKSIIKMIEEKFRVRRKR